MPSELISTRELAELWSCSVRHIERLKLENALPYLKLGKSVRFRLSDIEAWLNAREHNGGDAA